MRGAADRVHDRGGRHMRRQPADLHRSRPLRRQTWPAGPDHADGTSRCSARAICSARCYRSSANVTSVLRQGARRTDLVKRAHHAHGRRRRITAIARSPPRCRAHRQLPCRFGLEDDAGRRRVQLQPGEAQSSPRSTGSLLHNPCCRNISCSTSASSGPADPPRTAMQAVRRRGVVARPLHHLCRAGEQGLIRGDENTRGRLPHPYFAVQAQRLPRLRTESRPTADRHGRQLVASHVCALRGSSRRGTAARSRWRPATAAFPPTSRRPPRWNTTDQPLTRGGFHLAAADGSCHDAQSRFVHQELDLDGCSDGLGCRDAHVEADFQTKRAVRPLDREEGLVGQRLTQQAHGEARRAPCGIGRRIDPPGRRRTMAAWASRPAASGPCWHDMPAVCER